MSKFLKLEEYDYVKGFIVAILSASLTALYNLLTTGAVIGKAQLVACLLAWITAWLWYLLKNVFTNSEWALLKLEPNPLP